MYDIGGHDGRLRNVGRRPHLAAYSDRAVLAIAALIKYLQT
jgi:hypothetical protein